MKRPQDADGGDALWIWRVSANILNNRREHSTQGGPLVCGLGGGLTTAHREDVSSYEML
jgi:hypothetical protein